MLVSTEWLAERLGEPDVVVVDMRWREDGSAGELFRRSHIPGAIFLDWTTDIVDRANPVAFMLAPPDVFRDAMEVRGIGDRSTVIAYSDRFGSGPYRLWWAARMHGHDQVRVLDGGLEKWIAESRPLSADVPSPRPATWTPGPPVNAAVARADDVLNAEGDAQTVVLDSRPSEQYRGEAVWFEAGPVPADPDGIARTPRGPIHAGRVPWAVSVPVTELFHEDRTMKSPEELRELFARSGVEQQSKAITYCGVGISASALLFGLVRAGVEDAALYDASWEEWGRDPRKPRARG